MLSLTLNGGDGGGRGRLPGPKLELWKFDATYRFFYAYLSDEYGKLQVGAIFTHIYYASLRSYWKWYVFSNLLRSNFALMKAWSKIIVYLESSWKMENFSFEPFFNQVITDGKKSISMFTFEIKFEDPPPHLSRCWKLLCRRGIVDLYWNTSFVLIGISLDPEISYRCNFHNFEKPWNGFTIRSQKYSHSLWLDHFAAN